MTPDEQGEEPGPAAIIANFAMNLSLDSASDRELFDYADALRRVGRRRDSQLVYELLLERVSETRLWMVRLFRGQLFKDGGSFSLAESDFRVALSLNPSSTVPYVFLGGVLAAQEKFAEAVEVLELGLEAEGDTDEVLVNLGLNLRALGRLDEAAGRLEKALAIDPNNQDGQTALRDVENARRLVNESQR